MCALIISSLIVFTSNELSRNFLISIFVSIENMKIEKYFLDFARLNEDRFEIEKINVIR